jgi:hypothetical protein
MAAIVLDIVVLFLVVIVALGGYFGLILMYSEIKKWVPEWRTLSVARKTGSPVLALTTAGGGNTRLILGSKDERGDPIFDTKNQFGIQIDPDFSGELIPDRLAKGLVVYHYCTTLPLAIDGRHALALQSSISTVRDEYPHLDFLTNDQLNALLDTPRSDLDEYCTTIIAMCDPDSLTTGIRDASELSSFIKAVQDRLGENEVTEGWVSYAYAFKNIATAYLSQDMHQYGLLIERKVRKQMDDLSKRMTMIFAFGLVVAGIIMSGAVAYMIIK